MEAISLVLIGVFLAGWGSLWYKLGQVETKILNHVSNHEVTHHDKRAPDAPDRES